VTPDRFALLRRLLSGRLVAALAALFRELGSWRDDDADRFVTQAVPAVQGTQRALAALTASFIAAQATEALGRVVGPPGVPDAAVLGLRAGVTPADVYRRPFVTLRAALADGLALPEALERGVTRLGQVAEMDMQQTYAESSRAAMRALPAAARPTGWRRVLVGPESCALCVVASTQRYTLADLNPIHPACDCTVAPLFAGEDDPGIEPDRLERVHAAVEQLTGRSDRGARAPDYRQLLVSMTPSHGELGPMLVRPRDQFTTAADLPS
jgi:hypothetical protein